MYEPWICTLCQIMQTILEDYELDFCVKKDTNFLNQHGFMGHHSTATNLLECTHGWIEGHSSGSRIDFIHIDFTEAFDSIVFSEILSKLNHCGIEAN